MFIDENLAPLSQLDARVLETEAVGSGISAGAGDDDVAAHLAAVVEADDGVVAVPTGDLGGHAGADCDAVFGQLFTDQLADARLLTRQQPLRTVRR